MHRGSWDEGGDVEMGEFAPFQPSAAAPLIESLRDQEKEREALTHINARQENRIENQQTKINELIGFYLVFQGVILTSVAQGSFLRCHNWWLPFTLSLIAAIAIILAVLHMLLKLSLLKIELDKNRQQAEKLEHLIMLKKQRPILTRQPSIPPTPANTMEDVSNNSYRSQHDLNVRKLSCGDHLYRAAYPTIVLVTLITFTVFILIGCHRILCFPGPEPDLGPPSNATHPE